MFKSSLGGISGYAGWNHFCICQVEAYYTKRAQLRNSTPGTTNKVSASLLFFFFYFLSYGSLVYQSVEHNFIVFQAQEYYRTRASDISYSQIQSTSI